MKIHRFQTDGFGSLKGRFHFPSRGLILFLAPNEAGKTTLLSAIREAFYGAPKAADTGLGRHLLRYAPAGGGPYNVRVEVEYRGRSLTIVRDFHSGTTRVFPTQSPQEDLTETFRAGRSFRIGEALFGLTREEFNRTLFVSQGSLALLQEAGTLTHALTLVAETQAGKSDAARAVDVVREALRRYPFSSQGEGLLPIETEISRLRDLINERRKELERIEAEERRTKQDFEAYEGLQKEIARLEEERERVRFLQLAAEIEQLDAQRQRAQKNQAELKQALSEKASLAHLQHFPVDHRESLSVLRGKIEALRRERERVEERLSQTEARTKQARRALSQLGLPAKWGEQKLQQAEELRAEIEALEEGMLRAKRQIQEMEERLRASDVEDVEQLRKFVVGLKPEEEIFLKEFNDFEVKQRQRMQAIQNEICRLKEEITEVHTLRSWKKRDARRLLFGGGLLMALSILPFFFLPVSAGLLLILTSLALTGCGAYQYLRAGELEKKRLLTAKANLEGLEYELDVTEQRIVQRARRLSDVAEAHGQKTPQKLHRLFGQWERHGGAVRRLIALENELTSLGQKRSILLAQAAWVGEYRTPVDLSSLSATCEALSEARKLRSELDRLLRQRQEVSVLREQVEAELSALESKATDILAACGIEAPTLEEGMDTFASVCQKAERLRFLEAILIPSLQRELPSPAWMKEMENRRADLQRQLEELAASHPGFKDLRPEGTPAGYEEQRHELDRRRQELRTRADSLRWQAHLRVRENRLLRSRLFAEQEAAKTRLRRAEAFQAAAELAIETLAEASQEVYAQWSHQLNQKLSAFVEELLPTYRNPRFNDRLQLAVEHQGKTVPLGSPEGPLQPSQGVLDMIYLLARVVISEYLSQEEALPLFLDDPLVHHDDYRFGQMMRLLLEKIAIKRQVFMVSCHEQRHRKFLTDYPHYQPQVTLLSLGNVPLVRG